MKKAIVVVGVILVLVVVAAVLLLSNLGSIIRAAVERFGSEATGTSVTLASADVSLTTGDGALTGLVVGNPKGYVAPAAFELGEISLKLDTATVTAPTIVVREVVIQSPKVTYELGNSLKSNLQVIQDNVDAYSKQADADARSGGGGGKRGGGGGAGAEKTTAAPKEEGRRFVIEHLYVRGGRVNLATTVTGGKGASTDIPEIHLKDIGKDSGGVTSAQVAALVVEELTRSSIAAAVRGEIEKQAKGVLDKIGGAVKDIFKKK